MSRILVVDDRPIERDFLKTLLGYEGHVVLEASDGGEALEATRTSHPDLVIVDLLMPTMDGFEFVRRVRSDASIAATRVVFYTASYLEAEARELAKQCGVEHIITKPAEPEELLRIVRLTLGSTGKQFPAPELERFRDEHLRLISSKLVSRAESLVPQLDALIDLTLQMASVRDTEQLLEIFCSSSRQIIGAREAIVLIQEDGGKSKLLLSGLEDSDAAKLQPRPAGGRMTELMRTAKGALGSRTSSLELGLPAGYPEIESWAAAPVTSPTQTFGWICATTKLGAREFSASDLRLLCILAAQAGRSFEAGRLFNIAQVRAEALEREVAERRNAEEHFRAVFEGALDAMTVFDDKGQMLEFNAATETLYGRPRSELLMSRIDAFAPKGTDAAPLWKAFFETGRLQAATHLERPDGTIREIEFVSRANFLPGRHLTVMRDVTERRELEEQLRQSQKMEAVGRLAGGVAHDFNNLLTVINGYSEMLAEVVSPGTQREYIQEILNAGERSSQLTHQLLAFSRRQVLQTEVLVLNSVVSRLDKMLRRLIGEDVVVVERLSPSLGYARLDRGQLEQVVMNLVVNSRDAMPRGGTLTIETSNVTLTASDCIGRTDASPGDYVSLAIADTGHGMSPETLGRLFEPFFTTKPVGQGTGLGLATVFGIVRQSGGHIRVKSEAGRGSTFTVLFPRAFEEPVAAVSSAVGIKSGGSETLLLVEDEQPVRDLACLILRGAGYHVLPVANGEDALQLSRKHKDPIHLLVTDVVMPGVNGVQLAAQISKERPGLKTLFVSGYTRDALESHMSEGTSLDLLQKPFKPMILLDRVRKALDGTATPGPISS